MTVSRWWLKRVVYALLAVDFVFYVVQDIGAAPYVLDAGSSLREVLAAFVTTIDLAAWFTLILLFEIETGPRQGRAWEGRTRWIVRGIRLACYVAILHTSFSNDIALREFRQPRELPPAADVCGYAGSWSFLRNREYIGIDRQNCATIGRGPEFFALSDDAVLTDRAGLEEGRILAWTDLAESLAWLLVVLTIEVVARVRTGTAAAAWLVRTLHGAQVVLYALILGIAAYWGSKGQIFYLWDEVVWVLGFMVIDGNLRARRRAPEDLGASPRAA